MDNNSRNFSVLYTKVSTKKRKVFQDGKLTVLSQNSSVVLYSAADGEIYRRVVNADLLARIYGCRDDIILGQYEIQIEQEVLTNAKPEDNKDDDLINTNSMSKRFKSCHGNAIANAKILKKVDSTDPTEFVLDSSLERIMRTHQIEAAKFLLDCLNRNCTVVGKIKSSVDKDIYDDENVNIWDNHPLNSTIKSSGQSYTAIKKSAITGAILGDEMGLGKTLTAIAVLWAFVKGGKIKAVIVCPSSLVDNWEKEIKRWLGVKLKPVCARSGPSADDAVDTFRVSHARNSPVLIISYEMFRKHAAVLNTVQQLDVLVCDEAHRLKNAGGTKTTDALSSCKASRRLILTGTPLQNDLEELYAVVSFAVPGYLGSLGNFRSTYQAPILQGQDSGATAHVLQTAAAAAAQLRDRLARIMIRRTQAEVLTGLLPPRTVVTVYIDLAPAQQIQYDEMSNTILNSLSRCPLPYDVSWEDEEAVETPAGQNHIVLSGLQRLRKICNHVDSEEVAGKVSTKNKLSCIPMERESELTRLFERSSKLQLVHAMLSKLWPGSGSASASGAVCAVSSSHVSAEQAKDCTSEEKVVLVSNFTSTLNELQLLADLCGWGPLCLRLDGSVPSDRRQTLVDSFNRPSDPRKLFLLSAKAGGMGINLIGGSRLIMMDCDWNPAIDKQAMARIWREGQKRAVCVYRLVAAGCLEHSILQRQGGKAELARTVQSAEEAGDAPSNDADNELPAQPVFRCRKDLESLLFPSTEELLGIDATESESIEDSLLREAVSVKRASFKLTLRTTTSM